VEWAGRSRTCHNANMVGPNKQFNQDEALQKALETFWVKGFEATSMQDLVDNMEINRASMYQTYGNKHAIFIESLDQYTKSTFDFMDSMFEASTTPLKTLKDFISNAIDASLKGQMKGCLMNNAAIELGPHDELVAEKIRYFWKQMEVLFNKLLMQAIKNKQLESKVDTKKLARLINNSFQGLVAKSKVNFSKSSLMTDIDVLFDLIKNSK